ncbi:MAG: hypothetical protein AB1757_01595 [Acidobacteriota bacterium]
MTLKNQEKLINQYLLGELSETERLEIEERFFKDDEFYQNLLIAEDELIYNYLRGALSSRERKLFEAQLDKSSTRREKVAVVKALMAEAVNATEAATLPVAHRSSQEERPSFWQSLIGLLSGRALVLQTAMAAAMLLFAVAGVWLWSQTSRLKSQVDIAQARQRQIEQDYQATKKQSNDLQDRNQQLNEQLQREQQTREALEKERAELQAEKERLQKTLQTRPASETGIADSVISFALESGRTRDESDEPQRLRLPRNARHIQLQLDLGSDDGKGLYRVEVKTFGGALVWSKDALAASSASWGKAVNLVVPAAIFTNGEYELTLKRAVGKGKFQDAGFYYFKTEKQ